MPRVTIEADVWTDWRYECLAEELGLDTKHDAIGRMAALWSWCTERQRDAWPAKVIGRFLRADPGSAQAAILEADLGELLPSGEIRVRGCRGRIEWLGERRAAAAKGGKASARSRRVSAITNREANRNQTDAAAAGQDGTAKRISDDSFGVVPHQTRSKRQPNGSKPQPNRSKRQPSDSDSDSDLIQSGQCEPDPTEIIRPDRHPDRLTRLFALWDESGRAILGERWRSPGEIAGRAQIRRTLGQPELAAVPDEQLEHGLRVLAAEARAKADTGDVDPCKFLRAVWNSDRILARAINEPDEDAKRLSGEKSKSRTHRVSTQTRYRGGEVEL